MGKINLAATTVAISASAQIFRALQLHNIMLII
ncbi:hypothetical protein Cpap_3245 [Ruminiclostridium papyrosolvens DSM 2782]|uniref:Uncharacterized protein n=1 Tax=Ruminiclostridium papyrosolvens DSM 2782 TaxID=588581 RepID=F1TA79_9FIRM|nr:hypothetical protein Cpap_3245 [Ruminiclostridium papyrosolvens DSM 2782]